MGGRLFNTLGFLVAHYVLLMMDEGRNGVFLELLLEMNRKIGWSVSVLVSTEQ